MGLVVNSKIYKKMGLMAIISGWIFGPTGK
jgi:hypothetical protein